MRDQAQPKTRIWAKARTRAGAFLSLVLACACASKGTAPGSASSGSSLRPGFSNVVPTAPELPVLVPAAEGSKVSESGVVAKPVTGTGDNFDAKFSPDGARLVFLSRNRSSHKQAQVYELNLGPMIERRVTFHDGDDSSPIYSSDGEKVLYSSPTDELKEEPYYVESIMRAYFPDGGPKTKKDPRNPYGPGDLYQHSLDGREIIRLTEGNEFDGDPASDTKGSRLLFTSSRAGAPNLFMMDGRGGVRQVTESDQVDRHGRFAPDGKSITWSRYSKDLTSAQVMLAEAATKKAVSLTTGSSLDLYPAWNPNGEEIVFSSNRGGKGFDLYVIDRKGQCLRRLTEVEGDEIFPSFSPDGKKLVFTGNQSGVNQVYLMDYRPSSDCLK